MIQTKRQGPWQEFVITSEWEHKTVDDIFRKIWEAPKKLIHEFRMEKKVLVNHSPANWSHPFKKGDRLSINLFSDLLDTVPPSYMELDILFEDDHLLIVNKPSGMDTHPNEDGQVNTLLNGVAYHLQSNGLPTWVKHIHRLDRDTTGAILFAKHPLIGSLLDRMLEQRKIKRTYIAMVQGVIRHKKGTIHAPIGRDRHHATRRRVSPNGQDAISHYQVIETDKASNTTLVKCWLDTGRTHQIRVHFSHLGFPLVGDNLYGAEIKLSRQALHAAKLEFSHPITHENIITLAPLLDQPAIFPEVNLEIL